MKFTHLAILTGAALSLAASAFAQALPSQKVLTADLAQSLIQEALAKCRADGYHVTAIVVDSGDVIKASLRDDGASISTFQIARLKASSVIIFNRPSGPLTPPPAGTPVPPPILPNTTNLRGGLPIMVDNKVIGAIAVSGAPGGDKDTACSAAALAKVADKLK